jgi:glyoxylase-like metal-dependent hydrolase (beta-lactamase superfamily II)
MRRVPSLVGACAVVIALTAGCAASREVGARAFQTMTQLHPSPLERRALPGGIESVCSRGSITWIVPVDDGGVVLIDTGFDDEARAIRHAVGDRRIHGILLTHAHLDHAAGTSSLDAPVWVGRADAPALRGEATFPALYPRLGEALGGIPVAKGPIHEVDGGEVVGFGHRRFTAVAVPGHTRGSIAWLLDDVLFGGDAIQAPMGDGLYPAPVGFTEDLVQAYASLRRLRDVPFRTLADAHYGVLDNAHAFLRDAVERDHDDLDRRSYPTFRPVGCGDDPPGT